MKHFSFDCDDVTLARQEFYNTSSTGDYDLLSFLQKVVYASKCKNQILAVQSSRIFKPRT